LVINDTHLLVTRIHSQPNSWHTHICTAAKKIEKHEDINLTYEFMIPVGKFAEKAVCRSVFLKCRINRNALLQTVFLAIMRIMDFTNKQK